MRVQAVAKFVRCKPLMVRQVAREIRGQQAEAMVTVLRFKPGRGAFVLRKVIISAMANAQENHGISPDTLKIAEVMIDEGPRIKRIQARAMGRANRIIKRTAHITVVVEDSFEENVVKPHGTKAKPRPSFAKVAGKKKPAAKKAEEAPVDEPVVDEMTAAEEVVSEESVVEETTVAEAEATTTEAEGTEKSEG